jgi:hypothetical protein
MGSMDTRIAVVGIVFLSIFVSGIWLTRSGKPYNTLVFTAHKLIGLAGGVFLGLIVHRTHQATPLGLVEIAAVAVTVLFFVATVAAGGLLSIEKPMPTVVARMHLVVPVLTVLATGGTLYLLLVAR